MTATEIRRRLADGGFSAVEVVRAHIARIEATDGALRAFIEVNPRAEDEAAGADRRLRCGDAYPLTGVPVAVKDNLAVVGMPTTCASRILRRYRPARDATVIARLRAAGAVILGKTNLDEFSMGSSTENSAFGPTRNPWDPERVPGGSSGGSATAVAARMAPVALGSDTGGSIRQPAAFCGVVGLKPTYGRVSRSGLVAFASSLDQVGPITRSVSDAAIALAAIAAPDPSDATSSTVPAGDYLAACSRGVRGLRIGLPRDPTETELDPEIDRAVRAAAEVLASAGARVEEVSLPHARYAIAAYYLVAAAEASSNLSRYDGVRYGERRGDEDDLLSMYRRSRAAGFGPEVKRRVMLGTYALSAGYRDRFYETAQRVRARIRRDLLDVFRGGTQLLLGPATPTTAFRIGEKIDDPVRMYLSDVYTVTASLAGLPAIAVPAGTSSAGLPIGVQLTAPPFDEETLFRAASVLERMWPVRSPPDAASTGATGA